MSDPQMQTVCQFAVGDQIERFIADEPDVAPQPGVVVARNEARPFWIYCQGETWASWFDTSRHDLIVDVRKKSA